MITGPAVPCTPPDSQWASQAAEAIWHRLAANGWSGYDPYDACLTKRLPSLFRASRIGRRGLTQAVKRCPVPLQPVLAVPAGVDAYTLGHAVLAGTRLARLRSLATVHEVKRLVRRLRADAWGSSGAMAWGYHFPVHTRFFSYEPPTPNLIVTAFVAKGLVEATCAGIEDCREDLARIVRFVLGCLNRVTDSTGQCIGYVPGEDAAVHNANMLAVLVLCDAAELCAEPAWLDEALACASFTVNRQQPDGSWEYSEEPFGRWVDGFHSGFVLEGLARVVRSTDEAVLRRSLEAGVAYYVAQLFGPAGEPKYYPDRPLPFDALSAAQGLETLHVSVGGAAARAVPGQVEWIRRHLVRPDGLVAYQVHRGWTDWREFPRWSSAPMLSALAGVAAGGDGMA